MISQSALITCQWLKRPLILICLVGGVTQQGHPSSSCTSKEPNSFVKLCREHSDCASAEQPGTLAGHMGWVARGEQEPAMEEAAFAPGIWWDLGTGRMPWDGIGWWFSVIFLVFSNLWLCVTGKGLLPACLKHSVHGDDAKSCGSFEN